MPEYRVAYYCTSCAQELSNRDVFYTHGVCPYCGAVSSSTITRHEKKSVLVESPRELAERDKSAGVKTPFLTKMRRFFFGR